MTAIGITLLWCILQVTVVSAAAILLYFLAARSGATARSGVALAGLLLAAALAPLAFLPWPHWTLQSDTANRPLSTAEESVETAETIPRPQAAPRDAVLESPLVSALNGFVAGLSQPPAPVEADSSVRRPVGWPVLIALLFLAASLTGLARFLLGFLAVRRSVRRARLVDDRSLADFVDVIRAELSCVSPVEIRESAEIATAATTGWRRPVLLLPPDWQSWTSDERRAVIAHELAHVKRHDFAAALISQAALAVNFYHPLVHWLAGRLRLEQELAADALAATISGGRASYLRTLAELALRRSDGRVAWPARAFLPSRRTFLRRIEMLRDPRRAVDRPAPLLRIASAACLLLFAVVVAGIRPDPAVAQTPRVSAVAPGEATTAPDRTDAAATPASNAVNLAAFIPPTASFVVTLRPQEILADPAVQPLVGEVEKGISEHKDSAGKALMAAGVTLKTVESVALGLPSPTPGQTGEPAVFAFRVNKPLDRTVLAKQADETKTVFGGVVYRFDKAYVTTPDEWTVLLADSEEMIMAMIVSGQVNRAASPWLRILKHFDEPAFAILVDAETVGAELQQAMQRQNEGSNAAAIKAMSATVMPLLEDVRLAGLSLALGKDEGLKGYALCNDESGANRVRDTLEALVTIGKNTLRQAKSQLADQSPQQQAMAKMFFPIAETLLDSATVQADGREVTLTAETGANAAVAMGLLLPAIQQAREAARRTVSMNNLKQIGLAFHNYHDVYGFFPPAVIEENGVKRSWRVEILPFVEGAAIYDQYRRNEPWDSEANKKVLEQMPAVFKDPSDSSGPTSTSYYRLTGNGAMASDKAVDVRSGGKGTSLGDIIDGTSNTILVVEAKRDIPWTKPEDIPFDPEQAGQLLQTGLGGNHGNGFLAALVDGSVHYFERSIGPDMLKALVTSAGGETVAWPRRPEDQIPGLPEQPAVPQR